MTLPPSCSKLIIVYEILMHGSVSRSTNLWCSVGSICISTFTTEIY